MRDLIRLKIVVNPDQTVSIVIEPTADPNKFIDVHSFDGKYDHKFDFKYSVEEKIVKFDKMKAEMRRLNVNMENTSGLDLIIRDIGNTGNVDTINNLIADDILSKIIDLLDFYHDDAKYSTYKLIIEDMNDMLMLGQCPQGRCTRLFIIYLTLT